MHIALYHNLPSGGAKRAVYEWTRRLAARHEIEVFTLSTAAHAFCDIRPFVEQHRVFDFAPRRLLASPWGRLNQLQRWKDLKTLTQIGQRVAREIDSGGYDVVFAHPCLYTFVPTVLQFTSVPSVYYLHEPFGRAFRRQFQQRHSKTGSLRATADRFDPLIALYKKRLDEIQRDGTKRTTRLLANSKFTRQFIKQEFRVDASISYLGVDADSFHRLPEVSKEDCVISVGEMTPRKGFGFLVEALALLPQEKRPTLKLVCNFQDASERSHLNQLAARKGVVLKVLSNLDTEQLVVEYNKARLCVYSPVMEPFGLVALEAMACSTPVVAVGEGGVRETMQDGETGLLTDREPQQFANAIADLLDDPKRCGELGRRGRVHVEQHWRWENSVYDVETHLMTVASR